MKLSTKSDLEALILQGTSESLTLEYKRSDSLEKADSRKNELCKDVSAFANSAGGTIVYGIPEVNQIPQPLDSGSDKSIITPEWIEQVLNSRVQPRIAGLQITQIDAELSPNQVYYVVDIPQATTFAPHQAPDKKYYRRFNFQAVAMEDYEIRDALKRSSTPNLRLEFTFADGNKTAQLEFSNRQQLSDGGNIISSAVNMHVKVINDSPQPSEYTIVTVCLGPQLILSGTISYSKSLKNYSKPFPRLLQTLTTSLTIPINLPVFKEAPQKLPGSVGFSVQENFVFQADTTDFALGYEVHAPGFTAECWGCLRLENGTLTIVDPS